MIKWTYVLFLIHFADTSHYLKCSSIKTKSIRCERSHLGSVPQNFPASVELLVIKDDELTGGFVFPEMPNLKKLTLMNVKIGTIQRGTFENLRALEMLTIYYSRDQGNLVLESGAFHSMFKLKQIRLQNTGLRQLPDQIFRDSSHLNIIYINNHEIPTINSNTFKPLTKVHQLNLMHNSISWIEEGAFECVDRTHKVPRVFLSNNRLQNIPLDIKQDTNFKLYIHDNPLVCDCNLLVPHNFMDRRAECSGPDDMQGTKLTDLAGKSIQCSVVCNVPHIVNGYGDHAKHLEPGQLLKIKCYPGYDLHVMSQVTCQEDGTFGSSIIPDCEKEMNDPEVLEDGSLRIISSAFSHYPNFVSTTCPMDTFLKSCKCVERVCQGVVMQERMCRVFAAPQYPTKAELTCIKDEVVLQQYVQKFPEVLMTKGACRNAYKMTACSNYIPRLARATNHGEIDAGLDGSCTVDCGDNECDMYIRCMIIKEKKSCDPFSIPWGTVTLNNEELVVSTQFLEGDVVTITCDEGYVLWGADGGNTVECVEADTYLPATLQNCYILEQCTLPQVTNVEARPDWTVYEGQTITLSCNAGFEGTSVTVDCQDGGVLDQYYPIDCREIGDVECDVPPIAHATVYTRGEDRLNAFSVEEGEQLTIRCHEGFQTTQQIVLTCMNSGKLDAEMPTCTEVKEEATPVCRVPRLRDGQAENHVSGTVIESGVVITFHCNTGYKLADEAYRQLTCVSSQYYEPNKLPSCRRHIVKCEVPVLYNGYYNGYQVGSVILKGERLVPKCFEGFDLVGPNELVCEDETFGGESNECEERKIDCVIPTITNGDLINEGAEFKPNTSFPVVCNPGYWTGYNSYTYINCFKGPDTYDPFEIPECQLPHYGCAKVAFPFMKPLLNAPTRGNSVKIECLEGYTLYGSNILQCSSMSAYSGRMPKCLPNNRCETPVIENGATLPNSSHVDEGMSLSVTCNEGFGIYGDQNLLCQGISWSGLIIPECRPNQELDEGCNFLVIENGYFSSQNYISPGSTLVLDCDAGYAPSEAHAKVKCVTGEVFEPQLLPTCVRQEVTGCPVPVINDGALVPKGEISIGQLVSVICEEGFTVRGAGQLQCGIEGDFEPPIPECEKKETKCQVPVVEHSIISPLQPVNDGDYYLVTCVDGFEIKGNKQRLRCTDGHLVPQAPLCVKKAEPCRQPNIKNGWLTTAMNGSRAVEEAFIPAGDSSYHICFKHHTPKQVVVTCLGDDVWSPPLPQCVWTGKTCDMPTIENGVITPQMSQVLPWTTLTITCNKGFLKNPDRNVQCRQSNDIEVAYDIPMPQCKRIVNKCDIPVISNGTYNGPKPLFTDDRFTIECRQGYQLVGGTGVLVCYKDDSYSNHLPICKQQNRESTSCSIPVIQNAQVSGTALTGFTIRVACEEGYSIDGASNLRCLTTGKYDLPFPQCVIKPLDGDLLCGQRSVHHAPPPKGDVERYVDAPMDDEKLGTQRIYGGEEAEAGEYPWNVIIEITHGRFCGGSIVGVDWVLTAGHCLLNNMYTYCNNKEGNRGCKLISPEGVVAIRAGVHNRNVYDDNWQRRIAVEVLIHPYFSYTKKRIDSDVGLIRVSVPFVYNRRVNRVCLPADGVAGSLLHNDDLFVSGWGKTNYTHLSNVLQKITVPYVDRARCNSNESYKGVITESMFCAGYQTGKIDACQGDSGGPLVYLGSNGTFVQGGIVSWGIMCAKENFYGVYTNLAYFYDWIMDYIKVN